MSSQIIVFADVDTRMPENDVANADVKIDIGQQKAGEIINAREGLWLSANRKSDFTAFRTNQCGRIYRIQIVDDFGNACFQFCKIGFCIFQNRHFLSRQSGCKTHGIIAVNRHLP